MLKTKIEEIFANSRSYTLAIRERVRSGLTGRSRQVVALATLAGVTSIGLAAAALDNSPTPNFTNATTAIADQQRADASEQADRSIRKAPGTPTASPLSSTLAAPAAPAAETAPAPEWVNPMAGGDVSSCYGPRWGTMHAGVDLFAAENEPIVSAGKGTVVASGWVFSGYGISVVVDHGNGYLTHYAHLNKAAVGEGDQVSAGDLIGYEGSTGDSTGPHLHFEVHAGMWNQVNPAPWLSERGVQIAC